MGTNYDLANPPSSRWEKIGSIDHGMGGTSALLDLQKETVGNQASLTGYPKRDNVERGISIGMQFRVEIPHRSAPLNDIK